MSKILVTGATGTVGQHVVSSLAAAGHEVRALMRSPASTSQLDGVEVVQGHLPSPQTLEPALRDVESVYLMWPGIPVERRTVQAESPSTHATSSTCRPMSPT